MEWNPSIELRRQLMKNIRLLTTEEISAVGGGMANTGGSLPHPEPSPFDRLIQWILAALR
jgi:hypothetical protein